MKWPLSFKKWFPDDTISLKAVGRETFFGESSRLVLILVTAIFISALGLVLVKNVYHQAFIKKMQLQNQGEALHTEWMKLLIEEQTWGGFDEVNHVASNQLNMVSVPLTSIRIITLPDSQDIEGKVKAAALDTLLPTTPQVSFNDQK